MGFSREEIFPKVKKVSLFPKLLPYLHPSVKPDFQIMRQLAFCVFLVIFFSIQAFAQVFTDSNLPIVIIRTDLGIEIPDTPKIPATMKIIFNGAGNRNYLTNQNSAASLNYNGKIMIEIRGSSTQSLPKKQYGLTTVKSDLVSNNNVSLLGMPSENDWILNGLGFDPSLVRDYLSYNLSRRMGNYATRTVYCEVVINDDYKGLYVLQEKIKAGGDRVDVTKIATTDNALPELSGGYITKADKAEGDPVAFMLQGNALEQGVTYIHELPKPASATNEQTAYVHNLFDALRMSARDGNSSLSNGYPSVIDVASFVDFILINELASNVDAYQFSTFFHKDRNGKLRAGPIWDFNLTYGNDLFLWNYDRSKSNVWQFSNGDNEGSSFWKDLFKNDRFRCQLAKRWHELTAANGPLNISNITAFLDQTDVVISEAVAREKTRWNTFTSHSLEVGQVESFIRERTAWMNSNLVTDQGCYAEFIPSLVISKINYNPSTTVDFPKSSDLEFIEITNNSNKQVDLSGIYFGGTGLVYQFPNGSKIEANAKLSLAGNAVVFESKYKVKPFGQFTRNLSNTTQQLLLLDGLGNKIDEVTYSSDSPWPNANGNGSFLLLTSADADNKLPENWTTSNLSLVNTEPVKAAKLEYYPNPVQQFLTIKATDVIDQLFVYSGNGQLIQMVFPYTTNYNLDMIQLVSGLYFVKIKTPTESYTLKIVRQR